LVLSLTSSVSPIVAITRSCENPPNTDEAPSGRVGCQSHFHETFRQDAHGHALKLPLGGRVNRRWLQSRSRLIAPKDVCGAQRGGTPSRQIKQHRTGIRRLQTRETSEQAGVRPQ
jgi:hypothetical protein